MVLFLFFDCLLVLIRKSLTLTLYQLMCCPREPPVLCHSKCCLICVKVNTHLYITISNIDFKSLIMSKSCMLSMKWTRNSTKSTLTQMASMKRRRTTTSPPPIPSQCTPNQVSASTHLMWPPAPAPTKIQSQFGWGQRPRWTTGTTIETDNKTERDITGVC